MLLWIIQISIISIILIFIVQNLLYFFKSTLTIPKIKDLVHSPQQKYEAMFNIISNGKSNNTSSSSSTHLSSLISEINSPDDYIQSLLPIQQTQIQTQQPLSSSNMKSELKQFLKSKLTNL
jgi:hypothetical protein